MDIRLKTKIVSEAVPLAKKTFDAYRKHRKNNIDKVLKDSSYVIPKVEIDKFMTEVKHWENKLYNLLESLHQRYMPDNHYDNFIESIWGVDDHLDLFIDLYINIEFKS